MLGKYIIFTVLLAFVTMEMVQGKASTPKTPHPKHVSKCYTCNSPSACKNPRSVLCNQDSANATQNWLNHEFHDLVNVINDQYKCVKTVFTFNNHTAIDIRGCAYSGVDPCSLHPRNHTLVSKSCVTCGKDLCNPAGTFSSPSFTILMSVFVGLLVLKLKC